MTSTPKCANRLKEWIMSNWYDQIVEACNEDAYYKCFDASTQPDPDPDTTYEKWYGPFEEQIRTVLDRHGVARESTVFFDDWCPNRTRHVTVERSHLKKEIIASLHALLVGDYRFWRIDVIVVGSINDDNRLAQLGISRDWILTWGNGRELLPSAEMSANR